MITEILPSEGLILCAVSGGVDSMYLLCRLREMGLSVAAAHYNHGLRGEESDRDEGFVREFCRERDIPFVSERGDAAKYAAEHHIGIEEAARLLRYDFLERAADDLGAAAIATAHTADDNAETVLMHLVRGAGLNGLCGIPVQRARILRPMLDTTRQEAEEYLLRQDIPHVEDSSNDRDDYMRNRLRHRVVPALKEDNPAFLSVIGRTARLLREDETYLEDLAKAFLAEQGGGSIVSAPALLGLPRPVARRVIRLLAGEIPADHTERILRTAETGGQTDVTGMRVACWRDRLYFGVRDSVSLPGRELLPGSAVELPEAGLSVRCEKIPVFPTDVHKSLNTFFFQCANIYDSISVTARKPGDRLRPVGRGCTKTLKALLEEMGVPPWERGIVPVLRDGKGLLALYGAGQGERALAGPGDRDILKVEFIREKSPKGEE